MNHEKIAQLLKTHRTVTLIAADNAPLIISFLFKSFKQSNDGLKSDAISERDLVTSLSDYLHALNFEEKRYPKAAKQYLTDWANSGFVRKYPGKSDDYMYELTASTESAIKWVDSLDKREFVGQESRLKNLFETIKELSSKSKRDHLARLNELELRKAAIEREIEDVRNGKMDVLDDRQIKEHYFLIEEMAKGLLSDFRQVEQNFRELDRRFRTEIITTSQTKGKVLEDLFERQRDLLEEDQGKSFTAFWEFLLSQSKQDEFEKMIGEVLELPAVKEVQRDTFTIANLRNDLIDAGDRTKRSTNSLLEQLRKYLEHKSFTENKRIYDNIQEILKVITTHQESDFTKISLIELDNVIDIDLTLAHDWKVRGYRLPEKISFSNRQPEAGAPSQDNDALFDQFEINALQLRTNIRDALRGRSHVRFTDFVREFGITKGVAEVVAYLDIASAERSKHIVDRDSFDILEVKNAATEKMFKLKVPKITFCK